MEEIQLYLDDAKESMENSIKHLEYELTKIRAGRATPQMLDGVKVIYYGSPTPISQVSSINTPDARTISIKPFEKNLMNEIEKAIRNSDLGLNPTNNGEVIIISVPPLTEERRKDLSKQAKHQAENAKVSIRSIRKETNEELRKLQKDGAAEDAVKLAEEKVQKLTDASIATIDSTLANKEKEIMTI
ncbi:MAG: ribosome recycling factor [Cytophagales bacterium]